MIYLKKAYDVAALSPDPSTQYGVVIVSGSDIITGFNHPIHQQKFADRDERLRYTEHAERAAIYRAAYHGVCTRGATMYAPGLACMNCARAIVYSGISKVVCHAERVAVSTLWDEEIQAAFKYFEKCGVLVEKYSGKLNATPVLISGKYWQP